MRAVPPGAGPCRPGPRPPIGSLQKSVSWDAPSTTAQVYGWADAGWQPRCTTLLNTIRTVRFQLADWLPFSVLCLPL